VYCRNCPGVARMSLPWKHKFKEETETENSALLFVVAEHVYFYKMYNFLRNKVTILFMHSQSGKLHNTPGTRRRF